MPSPPLKPRKKRAAPIKKRGFPQMPKRSLNRTKSSMGIRKVKRSSNISSGEITPNSDLRINQRAIKRSPPIRPFHRPSALLNNLSTPPTFKPIITLLPPLIKTPDLESPPTPAANCTPAPSGGSPAPSAPIASPALLPQTGV